MIRILLSNKLGELKMTQADLARMTGIRPNTINELYNEFAERVNLQHLDLICEALNCDLSEILVYTPNTIPQVNRTRAGFKKEEYRFQIKVPAIAPALFHPWVEHHAPRAAAQPLQVRRLPQRPHCGPKYGVYSRSGGSSPNSSSR